MGSDDDRLTNDGGRVRKSRSGGEDEHSSSKHSKRDKKHKKKHKRKHKSKHKRSSRSRSRSRSPDDSSSRHRQHRRKRSRHSRSRSNSRSSRSSSESSRSRSRSRSLDNRRYGRDQSSKRPRSRSPSPRKESRDEAKDSRTDLKRQYNNAGTVEHTSRPNELENSSTRDHQSSVQSSASSDLRPARRSRFSDAPPSVESAIENLKAPALAQTTQPSSSSSSVGDRHAEVPDDQGEDDKMRRRRERLQRWKEEQERKRLDEETLKQEENSKSQPADDSAAKVPAITLKLKIPLRGTKNRGLKQRGGNMAAPDVQESENDAFGADEGFSTGFLLPGSAGSNERALSGSRPAFMARAQAQVESNAENAEEDEDRDDMDNGQDAQGDDDPLDAFMAQLEPGPSANNTAQEGAGEGTSNQSNIDAAKPVQSSFNQVISFEEIMKNVSKQKSDTKQLVETEKPNTLANEGSDSGSTNKDTAAANEDDSSFHAAFLEAARKLRNAQDATPSSTFQNGVFANGQAELLKPEAELGRGEEEEDGIGIMGEDDTEQDAILAELEQPTISAIDLLKEKAKKKELPPVDHSKIDYQPFTKNFYVEAPSIQAMSKPLVELIRKDLEITVRGARPFPKPIEEWSQCGLNDRIMNVLMRRGWNVPFAIQRQAVPAIMGGRDVIAVAKTGSGKTLAFVVPMLRHVLDQRPLEQGDGPIALIMAPARELAVQINEEVKKFAKACQIESLCCYGGVSLKEQISSIKRGVEVLVATPGRLIDLLTANNGRLLSLQRVTFLVLDEADRMFDMGFEPQIMKVIRNTRPDRQIVMFSATFPPLVEKVASEVLKEKPTIIVVGGRAKPPSNIKHLVEVRQPNDKFQRLLQILGEWYDEEHQILVFVKSQASCDKLFQQLVEIGYQCLTLHGGKDQIDRDNTVTDFKNKVTTLMLATGVAARGLDVADLRLVINYDVPNHLEELIHRIGRTGRAGRQGTAFTFIVPDEAMYAPDLVKALRDANQEIPPEVQALSDEFKRRIKAGEAKFRSSGYRGSGFKFTDDEKTATAKQQELLRKAEAAQMGIEGGDAGDDADVSESIPLSEEAAKHDESIARAQRLEDKFASASSSSSQGGAGATSTERDDAESNRIKAGVMAAIERAKDSSSQSTEFLIINDYPTKVRWKMTHKDTLNAVTDKTGAGVTVKGQYCPPGQQSKEPPLFLLVEGASEYDVTRAAAELKRILEEATRAVAALPINSSTRYTVL